MAGVPQLVLSAGGRIPRCLRRLIVAIQPSKYVIGVHGVILGALLQFLDRVHVENLLLSALLGCFLAGIIDLETKIGVPLEVERVDFDFGLPLVDSGTVSFVIVRCKLWAVRWTEWAQALGSN